MKLSLSFAKIICFLLFFGLASCSIPENTNQQTAVNFGSGLTKEFPSPIKETLVPEESTPLPASTSSPFLYLFDECTTLSIKDKLDISDRLVLWSIKDEKPVFIDANSSAFVSAQNIQHVSILVSPNGSKMAYIQESPRKIVIVSSLGETLRSFNIPENWVWPISWVSETSIFFEKRDHFGESRFEPGKLIAFDIETGEFLELYPDFPDIVPWVEGYPNWAGNMTFLPNPMLDFTIYAVAGGVISLWNLDSKTEVKRIYDYVNINSDPVWSQTGKWFIVNIPLAVEEDGKRQKNWDDDNPYKSGQDLFLVLTTGELQRLTYFSTIDSPRITGLSLSPDEAKLAFWIDTEFKRGENFDWQLGILDIQSGAVQLFCFSPGKLDSPKAPVWSPDGQNVIVTKYDENEFADAEVLLIEHVSNEIFLIQKNAVGIGYLMPGNPPEK